MVEGVEVDSDEMKGDEVRLGAQERVKGAGKVSGGRCRKNTNVFYTDSVAARPNGGSKA